MKKIGIIGGGISGLTAAFGFDYLTQNLSQLEINYDPNEILNKR